MPTIPGFLLLDSQTVLCSEQGKNDHTILRQTKMLKVEGNYPVQIA